MNQSDRMSSLDLSLLAKTYKKRFILIISAFIVFAIGITSAISIYVYRKELQISEIKKSLKEAETNRENQGNRRVRVKRLPPVTTPSSSPSDAPVDDTKDDESEHSSHKAAHSESKEESEEKVHSETHEPPHSV